MVSSPGMNSRWDSFDYICQSCGRCCYDKDVRVNPYEVARLAANRGQTTTEFRAAWTRDGKGTLLNQTDGGACVFLGHEGCTVYPDRPFACRLYPLGRHVDGGGETFRRVEGHPQSAGEFVNKGSISQYLERQGAEPFIQATDEYFKWACAAHASLNDTVAVCDREAGTISLALDLLDIDAVIASHCRDTRQSEPLNLDERKKLHLALLPS